METETKPTPVNIELRSEEVQDLMGRTSPYILRFGIGIILLLTLGFCVASAFIKYPSYISVRMKILPDENIELIKSMHRGTILSVTKSNGLVRAGDTLCMMYTEDNDTLPIVANISGNLECADFLEGGTKVEVDKLMFVVLTETEDAERVTDMCIYMPYEGQGKYKIGDILKLKIGNNPYNAEITAQTYIPNENGEYVIRCRVRNIPVKMFMNTNTQQAQMLIDDKTIFEKFFRKYRK